MEKSEFTTAVSGFVIAIAAGMAILPLMQPDPSYFYWDDFFYYLLPAKHFLRYGSYYFFPGMPTNGFHPLWMGIVTLLLWIAGGVPNLLFYALLNAAMALLAYEAFRQSARFVREQGGTAAWSMIVGLIVLSFQLTIGFHGMEVALALPLLIRLTRVLVRQPLDRLPPLKLFGTGVLASCVILARIDSAMLLAPFGLFLIARDRLQPRTLTPIASGFFPLVLYLALNHLLTHQWLPVSGQAKQLKESMRPTFLPLTMLFQRQQAMARTLASAALLPLLVWALARPRQTRNLTGCFLAASCGVILYYAVFCVRSDWELFLWYLYPLAWLVVFTGAAISRVEASYARWIGAFGASAFLAMALLYDITPPRVSVIWEQGRTVAAFVRDHPGNYAMGDAAGAAAYLSDANMLQMEGLMGNREFLDHIRHRDAISGVLRQYKIDYYVYRASMKVVRENGCLLLSEPLAAGPESPKMHGRACSEPLLSAPPILIYQADQILP